MNEKEKFPVVIDVNEMAERYGMPMQDVYKPDGTVAFHKYSWDPSALPKAVAEVKDRAAGQSVVKFVNFCPNWMSAAFAAAIRPAVSFMNVGPNGMYNSYQAPFRIGEKSPACDLYFEPTVKGEFVYLTVKCPINPHLFDMDKMPLITVPAVEPGKVILLSGIMTHPMAINAALAYADTAKAFFISFHEAPEYVCCVTNCDEYQIGDTIPVGEE